MLICHRLNTMAQVSFSYWLFVMRGVGLCPFRDGAFEYGDGCRFVEGVNWVMQILLIVRRQHLV